MLCIRRKKDETIKVGTDIVVMLCDLTDTTALIGFSAPKYVPIWRSELFPLRQAPAGPPPYPETEPDVILTPEQMRRAELLRLEEDAGKLLTALLRTTPPGTYPNSRSYPLACVLLRSIRDDLARLSK